MKNSLRILHTADLHFSNTPDKLEESIRTTDFILDHAETERPDVIILAGDLVDEMDGRIRLDSDTARAAIRFVIGCGDIAPTVIVRGTKSHDRETPTLFRHLKTKFPVHVSDKIEMVGLLQSSEGYAFQSVDRIVPSPANNLLAVFTMIPSLDKASLVAQTEGLGIREANADARVLFGDMFAAIGEVNAEISAPRIMVGHGMITGAEFSSGQTAIGEDLEYGVEDIRRGNFDLACFGHVHKHQILRGNIVYSGSPGRMNFGETEEKGFCIIEID